METQLVLSQLSTGSSPVRTVMTTYVNIQFQSPTIMRDIIFEDKVEREWFLAAYDSQSSSLNQVIIGSIDDLERYFKDEIITEVTVEGPLA